MRPRCVPWLILTLLTLWAPLPAALAQDEMDEAFDDAAASSPEPERPESARRHVRSWDFEDAPVYARPVPFSWYRAQDNPPSAPRPGFPVWNRAELDNTVARSGAWSVRLPTQGGSTSLMLDRGVIPAMPNGDYLVSSAVRTKGLSAARARLAARMLDEKLVVLDGTEAVSHLVVTDGEWETVTVGVRGHERATWLQIELQVLQPSQFNSSPRGAAEAYRVLSMDVDGAAWFDDIQVFQTPRVDLYTPAPGGLIIDPEPPTLVMNVLDLTGESLTADLRVYDMDGAEVAGELLQSLVSGRPRQWAPTLPAYGWYRATLQISGPDGVVGQAHADFVWAPARRVIDREKAQRFGINLPPIPPDELARLPELVSRLQTGAMTVSVWPGPRDGAELLRSVIESLIDLNQDLTFVLSRVPPDLARQAGVAEDDVLGLLAGTDDTWVPHLSPLLAKFGERVRHYQLGSLGDQRPFWREDLGGRVGSARQRLAMFIPRPVVVAPWSLHQRVSHIAHGIDGLAMTMPISAPAASIGPYASTWQGSPDVSLTLELPDAELYGRRAVAVEAGRRAIQAWAGGVPRISIAAPWSWPETGAQRSPLPRVEASVWRTITEALCERLPAGLLPAGEGVTVIIAQGARDSALVAWNNWLEPEKAVLSGYLGAGEITVRDLFGNTWRPQARAGVYSIPLTEMPLFIEGIDPHLARFRAAMHIEPPFVPARAQKHYLEVVIENTFPEALVGRLRIAEPADWDITPRLASFTIPPGRTERIPVAVSFGLNEEAGDREVIVEAQIAADRQYPTMRIPLQVELGLEFVQLQPSLRLTRRRGGEGDVEVAMLISNTSERTISLEAFAQAPGLASQHAPISALPPGQSVVRRFVFEAAADRLRGRSIRVGLKEQNGTGRLNRTLEVP